MLIPVPLDLSAAASVKEPTASEVSNSGISVNSIMCLKLCFIGVFCKAGLKSLTKPEVPHEIVKNHIRIQGSSLHG